MSEITHSPLVLQKLHSFPLLASSCEDLLLHNTPSQYKDVEFLDLNKEIFSQRII